MKQVQDHYFKRAKKEGYVARSAYKLKEIQQKHHLIKPGQAILDLGCFPGSWMQYISEIIGDNGLVVGIDRTKLNIRFRPNMRFIRSDIDNLDLSQVQDFSSQYDLVCSDMAPNTTGIRNVDSERSLQLCQSAARLAQCLLRKGGATLLKIFQGSSFEQLLEQMKKEYHRVKIIKPKSSRTESKELFVLGKDKK